MNIKSDQYGYYFDISPTTIEQINNIQEKFTPYFVNVIDNYSKFEEWGCVNIDRPFVFSPETINIITKRVIPEVIVELINIINVEFSPEVMLGKFTKWSLSDIEAILNKLLAYESFRLERIIASKSKSNISNTFFDENVIYIKELCTGAGITTALMFEELIATGKDVVFHSVDNSLQAIASAAVLLTLRGIPNRIVLDDDMEEQNFSGVTLHFESMENSITRKNKYHMIFSDNGINYEVNENTQQRLVVGMINALLPNGFFWICSLDPKVRVNLSIFEMFKAIVFQNKLRSLNKKEYEIRQVGDITHITQFFSPSSMLQYELLHQLLMDLEFGLFIKYLSGAKKAGDLTQKLSPKIQMSIERTGAIAESYCNCKGEYFPSFSNQQHSLTRVFEIQKC